MNFASLVPGDTPFKNMTKDPAPGVGPYMFTKSVPNREFVLEKNPNFEPTSVPGIPTANVGTVKTVIIPSVPQQTQDVINNELDFMQEPPAPDLVAEILESFGPEGSEEQRYKEFTTLSTYYFFLNNRIPPFDDPKVREAVNLGLDKPALARLFAGTLGPGCSFLPPEMPGYAEALDIGECPWGDPNEAPDLKRAQQMIKEAGRRGRRGHGLGRQRRPDARRSPRPTPTSSTRWASTRKPKILDGGVYFQTIGNEETAAQTGFLNWFGDFPHPANFFFLVDGDTIQPTNNQNMSYVDDPKINQEIDRLARRAGHRGLPIAGRP